MDKNVNNSHCIQRIEQHYPLLCSTEKKAADIVLENWKSVRTLTVAEWAERAGVSPASIVRFCKSIGFKSVSAFKQYLHHEEMITNDPDFWESITENTTSNLIAKVCNYNSNMINESISVLVPETLEKVVDCIAQAHQIYFIAVGASSGSAYLFMNMLLQMGINCTYQNDPVHQIFLMNNLHRGDVVITVNYTGAVNQLATCVNIAKERGAKTIGITGIVGSPLDKAVDYSLYCGTSANESYGDLISSRISELNVLSVISTMLSQKYGKKAQSNRERNKKTLRDKKIIASRNGKESAWATD